MGGFERISFIDQEKGWATNSQGQVWATQDGGLLWTPRASVTGSKAFANDQIKFVDESTGWFLEPFSIFRTTDGGDSWAQKEFETPLASAYFLNEKEAWAFDQSNGFYERMMEDLNGRLDAPRPVPGIFEVSFVSMIGKPGSRAEPIAYIELKMAVVHGN